jgi:hypothetical protein
MTRPPRNTGFGKSPQPFNKVLDVGGAPAEHADPQNCHKPASYEGEQ